MKFDYKLNPFATLFVKRYCFDIEANGLLKEVSLFFCAVIEDVDTGEVFYYDPDNVDEFLAELSKAQWLIGHNIIGYDLPALYKLHGWKPRPETFIYDTVIASRIYNPHLEMHPDCPRKVPNAHDGGKLKNVGPHTLMNLGFHVGCHKGDFGEDHAFDEYCPEMMTYCAQDVTVNVKVFNWLQKKLKAWSLISVQCEMDTAKYISQQMRAGWYFNVDGADKLRNTLTELKAQIEEEVRLQFPPILKPHAMETIDATTKIPKVTQPRVKADGTLSSVGVKAFFDNWEDVIDIPDHRKYPGHTEYSSGSFTKLQTEIFNLGSRAQIAKRLQMAGITLTKKTPKGNFIIDDGALKDLAKLYPEIPQLLLLCRYFKVQKILSMVENWIKAYDWETGCIHGYVNSVGAVTNRMTHSHPNVAQTPSSKVGKIQGSINPTTMFTVMNFVDKPDKKPKRFVQLICSDSYNGYHEGDVVKWDRDTSTIVEKVYTHHAFVVTPDVIAEAGFSLLWGEQGQWGADCRDLFTVREGRQLVGCDASGLELRCLAHYMNDANYTDLILHGDIHTYNQKLAGLPTRPDAKTFIYAFLYGAGDAKIGQIVGGGGKEGKKLKAKFLSGLPKLKRLIEGVKDKAETTGAMGIAALKGIDGRRIRVRSSHAALNSLLQSCGAIIMKYWLIAVMEETERRGLDVIPVGNIHDEGQFSVADKDVKEFADMCEEKFVEVSDFLKFRCPLAGESKVGPSWAHTH